MFSNMDCSTMLTKVDPKWIEFLGVCLVPRYIEALLEAMSKLPFHSPQSLHCAGSIVTNDASIGPILFHFRMGYIYTRGY